MLVITHITRLLFVLIAIDLEVAQPLSQVTGASAPVNIKTNKKEKEKENECSSINRLYQECSDAWFW